MRRRFEARAILIGIINSLARDRRSADQRTFAAPRIDLPPGAISLSTSARWKADRGRSMDSAGVGWLSYRNNRGNVTSALTASVFM